MNKKTQSITMVTGAITKRTWLINNEGKRITPKFRCYTVREFDDFRYLFTSKGRIVYNVYQKDVIMMENKSVEIAEFIKISEKLYELIFFSSNTNKSNHYLYNPYGELISSEYSHISPFKNGYAAVTKNAMIGFIDEEGKLKIEPSWCFAGSFNEYGYAIVRFKGGGKIGIIDKNGTYVTKPLPYRNGFFLTENLIHVFDSTGEGVITLQGNIIVPTTYDSVKLTDNYLQVRSGDNYGLFDLQGNCIFECIYPEIIEMPDRFIVRDFAKKEIMKMKEATQ